MKEAELAQRIQALERRVARLEVRQGLDSPETAAEVSSFASDPADVPTQEIVALIQQGKKIHAVNLYRELTGAGLGDAKAAVDRIEADYLAGG